MKEQNKKYLNIKQIKKQVKGITLIALVVTIIVLLILAGVALNLTIGQNGIFSRAQDAADTWKNAETNEQLAMQEGADLIDQYLNGNGNDQGSGGEYNTGTTVSEAKNQNKFFKEDTTIKDDLDNDVRVPEGFKIAQDSATKVENGVVIEDKDGNQFVWIPAKTGEGVTVHTEAKGDVTIVYKRTAYTGEDITTDYTETLPTDEETSVNANGGYYIGRFEAGNKELTDSKIMNSDEYMQNQLLEYAKEIGIDMNNPENITEEQKQKLNEKIEELENKKFTVTIKKDQVPYNNITIENCKSLAEGMSKIQGYSAKTKLVSSYAWDTAISFIQITNEDYGSSSLEGNYEDTTFSYVDINGDSQTKNNDSSTLVPTGQTTAICNIYDMGGNFYEYTTESYSNIYTVRGGNCYGHYADYPAGYRGGNGGYAGSDLGFRITLYL